MPIIAVNGQTKAMKEDLRFMDYIKYSCKVALQAMSEFKSAVKDAMKGDSVWKILEQYFKCTPDDVVWLDAEERIRVVIGLTMDALEKRNITIKVVHLFPNVNLKNMDLIEMTPATIMNEILLVRYLIHEATHLYAGTIDHADRGYVNNDGQYRQGGLTQEEALNNADSYAAAVTLFYFRALV